MRTPPCLPRVPSAVQVVAHSVGTWVAYELLRAVQAAGLPLPAKVFLSGEPWQHPWCSII